MSQPERLTEAGTHVGLGFGAIQAGLLLEGAHRNGRLGRPVVASLGRIETGVQQLRAQCGGESDNLEYLLRRKADG